MRTYTHVIDTMAVKKTLNAIPNHWVVRELSERDYGIDLMIEIFEEDGTDANGRTYYETTGHVCYLQIKGTNKPITFNIDTQTASFSISKKALFYVEKFATPFLLVRASTSDEGNQIYFLWLQRYILDVLEAQQTNWRTTPPDSLTVLIPATNVLPDNPDKIERIASRIKFIEEFSEFYEKYMLMKDAYHGMIQRSLSNDQYDLFVKDLKRIRSMSTLMKYNNAQVTEEDITELIDYVLDVKVGSELPTSEADFPDPTLHNLDLLLSDNFMRIIAENMIAENEDDTVY